MDAFSLKQSLVAQLEDTLAMLLPDGKRKGNYYHVGSLGGEPGDSLRVCLSGAKRGIWVEGSDGTGGDIMDLWCGVRGVCPREMLSQVREYLAVPERRMERRTVTKRYVSPNLSVLEPPRVNSAAMTYLASERKLERSVIEGFKVSDGKRDGEIAFPYFDEEGELRMVKYISIERNERGKKKVFTTPDSMPILFGMNTELVTASTGELLICEGEIDAMSWQQFGVPAVSVPFGAKGESSDGGSPNDEWIENCWGFLERFHTVYVSMDMDKEGEAAAAAIIHRLGRERCRMVELPENDANACLLNGVDVLKCLSESKTRDPDDLRAANTMMDRVWKVIRGGRREEQGIPFMDWDVPFKLRPSEGTIWTGYGGHGKSNLLYQMVTWLACVKNTKVFIGSYEEPADAILAIMAAHAMARVLEGHERKEFLALEDSLYSNVIVHDFQGTMPIDKYFEYAEYAVRRHGCRHVILDSLTTTDVDLDDKAHMDKFAKASQRLWKETGCHLHTVAHPRKGASEEFPPLKPDVKGGGTIGDLYFNCLTVHRPKNDQEYDGQLICSKQKVGGKLFKKNLFFSEDSYRVRTDFNAKDEPYVNSVN